MKELSKLLRIPSQNTKKKKKKKSNPRAPRCACGTLAIRDRWDDDWVCPLCAPEDVLPPTEA